MSDKAIIAEQGDKLLKVLETEEKMRFFKEFNNAKNDSNERVLFIEDLLKKHNLIPNFEEWKQKKDQAKSDLYRNEGNKYYKQKRFLDALENYNKSLCYAPLESGNIGLAYANRSAVYMEMGHHIRVVENIELARNHNYPKDKLDKLNDREEKCLELMNDKPDIDGTNENEKIIKEVLGPKIPGNKKAPCYIANCLELRKSEEFGCYIVTKKDLEVGTVVAIEEPFSSRTISSIHFERCLYCTRMNLLHLIPCNFCCSAMFCSEECKKNAWEKFHQFECEVVDPMEKIFPNNWLIGARTFFESLHLFNNDPGVLNDFLKSSENSKVTVFDFDFSEMGESEKRKTLLHVIDGLETHEANRGLSEIFTYIRMAATLSNLFLNYTKLGSILNEDNRAMFRRFIFKRSMATSINSHGLTAVSEKTFEEVEFEDIGIGFFPFCSLFNHSCTPNVVRICFRQKSYLIVSRPVKAGEQLYDSYSYHHFAHRFEERQAKLQKHYFFKCRCAACQSPKKFPLFTDLTPPYGSLPHLIQQNDNLKQIQKKYEICCHFIQREQSPSFCLHVTHIEAFFRCMKFFFVSNEH